MRWKLLVLAAVLVALPTAAAAQQTFFVDITLYRNDTVAVNGITITDGGETLDSDRGAYAIRLVDGAGETLHEARFDASFTVVGQNRLNEVESARRFFRLPYEPGAERVAILHDGETIGMFDIPRYACVPDGRCPAYCEERGDQDCAEDGGDSTMLIVGVLLAFFLGLVAFLLYRTRQEQDAQEPGLFPDTNIF